MKTTPRRAAVKKMPAAEQRRVLLDIDALSVRLGATDVLDAVSFCVHSQEFIGLIGPNGAGKTSLVKTMLGLRKPSAGKVTLAAKNVGYIPQHGNNGTMQLPFSVMEAVALGARGDQAAAHRALEQVGMAESAAAAFTELSGGQQQRVLIAKALAGQPELLILDEPTTGIDERSQREFYAIMEKLKREGIAIIIVSHDIDAVLSNVSRVICLNRTVLYDGSPQNFEAERILPSFYTHRHVMLHHRHDGTHHNRAHQDETPKDPHA